MSTMLYELSFSGELIADSDPTLARKNLGQLFKANDAQLDRLFSGKRIVIKNNLELPSGRKYLQAFKKAGAIGRLHNMENGEEWVDPLQATPTEPVKSASAPANFGTPEPVKPASAPANFDTPEPAKPASAPANFGTPEPVKPASAPANFGTSEPVKPASATANFGTPQTASSTVTPKATTTEKQTPSTSDSRSAAASIGTASSQVEVDTPSWDIAPTGSDMQLEYPEETAKAPDTSHLSIGPMTGNLVEPEDKDIPPPPDTSHLKLAE